VERKKLFLALSFAEAITLFFIGCGKKESTGVQQEPPETKFTSPDEAATKTFGNFSAGPASISILTARLITARIITGRVPAFIPISKILNQPEKNYASQTVKETIRWKF
jgi:hypothetical protein